MAPVGSKTAPEARARDHIDHLLRQAGWVVQARDDMNLSAGLGVAVAEFPLKKGHGFADYLLFVAGKPVGVVEAKPAGTTLTGVETQAQKYVEGMPPELDPPLTPLPFAYMSTGVVTKLINHLDPHPRSRRVFNFARPETMEANSVRTLEGNSVGTTMTNLNQEILLNLPIPLLPFAEQARVVDEIECQVSTIASTSVEIDRRLERCPRLRQAILKWAFEGKLVDQDPNDEPAEKLLERIRAEREAAAPTKKKPGRKPKKVSA